MSLYGKIKDINLFKSMNRELLENIIEQQVGYYKPKIEDINTNVYGEATNKTWIGPVLIKCLIERGEQAWKSDEFGADVNRIFRFRFLKDHLIAANVLTETGDVILWENDYYMVDGVIQNQLVVGKSNEYNYSDSVVNYGTSLSIILQAHYTRKEALGIDLDRL